MVTATAQLTQDIPNVYVTRQGIHRFAPSLSQAERRRILEQNAKIDRAEAAWIAKGRPWTEDDEALLERMTGY